MPSFCIQNDHMLICVRLYACEYAGMLVCIGILSSTKVDVTTELAKCYLHSLPFSDPISVSEDERCGNGC